MNNSLLPFQNRFQIFVFDQVNDFAQLTSLIQSYVSQSKSEENLSNSGHIVAIDLSLVVSLFHIQSAVMKSLVNESSKGMKTKAIASEIMYQLAPTAKINVAIDTYTAKPTTTLLGVIFIDLDVSSKALIGIVEGIEGKLIDPQLLNTHLYLTKEKIDTLIKAYKITPDEYAFSGLEDTIVTKIATKDI